jgi:hypothetical protein
VDDFGVKYEKKDNAEHLFASIKSTYRLTKDWTGNLYCSITLDWDYVNRTVDISMTRYIKKKLQEYNHILPGRLQACLYTPAPKKFCAQAQTPLEVDSSPQLDAKGIKRVQQNSRQHPLLCKGSRHDGPHGPKCDCCQTN